MLKYIGVIILNLLLIATAYIIVLSPVSAKDVPLFVQGKTYGVITGCFPTSPPCFGEKLKVTNVRSDGWIDVLDENGKPWTYNPDQIIAVMEFVESINAE